jgi:hypothetical protein
MADGVRLCAPRRTVDAGSKLAPRIVSDMGPEPGFAEGGERISMNGVEADALKDTVRKMSARCMGKRSASMKPNLES